LTDINEVAVAIRFAMLKLIDNLLEARGFGWTILRFAIILTPAIIALVALSTVFR
jgi:hypothetical protein